MKIEFIDYFGAPHNQLQFRILGSPDEAISKQRLIDLFLNTVSSMGMTLWTYNGEREWLKDLFVVTKCDSLSAFLFNIRKRVLESGVSEANWNAFLGDIRKYSHIYKERINIDFGSNQKLDTLPEDMRLLVADYLTGKEVARLSHLSHFFRDETKQIQIGYWRKKIIAAGCRESLLSEAIKTGAVTDYKVLYRVFLKKQSWIKPFEISNLGTLFCLSGDVGLVQYAIHNQLVDANFKVELINDSYFLNAFALTTLSGSAQCMQEAAKIPGICLIPIPPDSCSEDNKLYFHPWGLAATSGSVEALRQILKTPELNVNAHQAQQIALHVLIRREAINGGTSVEAIQLFNEIPEFDVNFSVGCFEYHILHTAAEFGSVETIQALVKFPGINILAVDYYENNVLHTAVKGSKPENIRFLRRLGLSFSPPIHFNTLNYQKQSPLMCISPTIDKEQKEKIKEALTIDLQPFDEKKPEEKIYAQVAASLSNRFFSQTNVSTPMDAEELASSPSL